MLRSRRLYLSLLGVIAWSITAAGTIFSILDAISLSSKHVSFLGLVVTASALNVVSLCCVGLFSVQHVWRREGAAKGSSKSRQILAACCVTPSVAALAVSLASIITIQNRAKAIPLHRQSTLGNWPENLSPHFALWALACLFQIVLYTSPLWARAAVETAQPTSDSGPRDSVMSEVRNSNQTVSMHMVEAAKPASLLALPSPTFSSRSSKSLKSWKGSLSHVIHPVTSRTKLINRPSFNRDSRSIYSDSPSIDNVSQPDGFDTWDTSSVDPQARDAVMQTAPSRLGTALEPIPGSRPASPARALDGPFPEVSDGRTSPALSLSPPRMHPDMSRPPSPAVSEAHIHPLFRTESPVPPPEATPGTSIVASPLSSQAISCPPRPYSRMRSNSRTTSPSLLMHSQSLQDLNKAQARPRPRSSRSPSPPSREMTPPIPDFVLNASPRSSLSGARRKINLRLDTSR